MSSLNSQWDRRTRSRARSSDKSNGKTTSHAQNYAECARARRRKSNLAHTPTRLRFHFTDASGICTCTRHADYAHTRTTGEWNRRWVVRTRRNDDTISLSHADALASHACAGGSMNARAYSAMRRARVCGQTCEHPRVYRRTGARIHTEGVRLSCAGQGVVRGRRCHAWAKISCPGKDITCGQQIHAWARML